MLILDSRFGSTDDLVNDRDDINLIIWLAVQTGLTSLNRAILYLSQLTELEFATLTDLAC